jgi:hypothetical protein
VVARKVVQRSDVVVRRRETLIVKVVLVIIVKITFNKCFGKLICTKSTACKLGYAASSTL